MSEDAATSKLEDKHARRLRLFALHQDCGNPGGGGGVLPQAQPPPKLSCQTAAASTEAKRRGASSIFVSDEDPFGADLDSCGIVVRIWEPPLLWAAGQHDGPFQPRVQRLGTRGPWFFQLSSCWFVSVALALSIVLFLPVLAAHGWQQLSVMCDGPIGLERRSVDLSRGLRHLQPR